MENNPLNQKNAAELLGVHRSTMRRFVRSGKLRCIKIGERKLLFEREDVLTLKQIQNDSQSKGGGNKWKN